MDDIFSPHKGGVQTPTKNIFDSLTPHHGGVVIPPRNLATFANGKPLFITIDGKALPASVSVTTTLNGKALNSNNLESMDKPKIYINIPFFLIGGLIIVFLMSKK